MKLPQAEGRASGLSYSGIGGVLGGGVKGVKGGGGNRVTSGQDMYTGAGGSDNDY